MSPMVPLPILHELPPIALDLGTVGHHGRGSDPEIPIQRVGHGRRRRDSGPAAAVRINLHVSDGAELSFLHEVARLNEVRSAAPLRAHLHHALVFARRGQHRLAFHHVHADGLLQVQVGARLDGLDHGQGMPVIRRGDLHQVEILLLEHLAVVGEHPRLLFGCLARGHHLGAAGHHLLVHVAEGYDFDRRHLHQPEDIGLAVPSAPDEPHARGRRVRGFGGVPARGRQCQRGHTALHEFTAVHNVDLQRWRPVYPPLTRKVKPARICVPCEKHQASCGR